MKNLNVLYGGDSRVGGAANYLLAVLKHMRAKVTHVPPNQKMKAGHLKTQYDVILLSDYPKNQMPRPVESLIVKQVRQGTGLAMIGGWASFSGPFGGWSQTAIEKLLPVKCLNRDDRLNVSGGLSVILNQQHAMFSSIAFKSPPVICGLNDVKVREDASVLIRAQKIVSVSNRLALDPVEYPLLVIGPDKGARSAVFTTDFAPHWCGGLVDWGTGRLTLPVNTKMNVEVGETYIAFISNFVSWLGRRL